MTESQQLIAELKTQLKLRGVHYADIATALDLSEGSVNACWQRATTSAWRVWNVYASLST